MAIPSPRNDAEPRIPSPGSRIPDPESRIADLGSRIPDSGSRTPEPESRVTCSTCELHAEAVFRVEGMDCHEEVVILERRLKPLPGVEALSADVMGQRLHIKYDAARLSTSALVDAVGQTGMRMWLEHDEPRSTGADLGLRLWLMLASILATIGGFTADAVGSGGLALGCFVAATIAGGVFPARRALTALRTRTLDINVLMLIAVVGALALGEPLEAASVVSLFAIAQWLEARTLDRARRAIRALLDLSPRVAQVRRDGRVQQIEVEAILDTDVVLVRPGEKIAVDGVVTAGSSEVNEAPLTGESLPVSKLADHEVFAGTINGHGALELRVTRVGRDTRLARITHLVEEAQAQRAPVQTFVDRFARIYTPAVIVLACGVAIVPPLVAGAEAATWLYRALTLLVIACPCALVISTPVSFVAALSAAARNGVLIKGGGHLERLAASRTFAFDKTGTLTTGRPAVTEVVAASGVTEDDLLQLAAAVEARSEHPIGRAVLGYTRARQLPVPDSTSFTALPGLGAGARVGTRDVLVGNRRLMASRHVDVNEEALPAQPRGATIFVAADGVHVGTMIVEDQPRETAREAIELLREQGVHRVVMLTGDETTVAARMAALVGVDEYHAGLMPEDKHRLVQSLRRRDGTLAMIGDGVNDAPALAAADIGIAMGAAGSDVAIEAADVALMSDELLKLPYAVRLARATVRNVTTNVAVSLLLKAAFLVMAIAGLATLWMAVLADTGASVIVVANALRLLRER